MAAVPRLQHCCKLYLLGDMNFFHKGVSMMAASAGLSQQNGPHSRSCHAGTTKLPNAPET
ncbi:hypothetical protein NEUTE1DRAFT_116506 [Neurospora tetrasperma FGSC 2508]|uniref:Uncharacterized protein n=1 Tax=Neurospora tetrasperma (strain FGSC 2508 / ATCC MYA-4615 / P0657) TaxID=510951 RepID=F8MG85_NEUT8|nr:uncharacterized protein NEUTE1DRAFT_116506 [Neurospora tetrasperma FGSC 2508]EGO59411.1 hypothetical protein NEUTE1DRAFT_116506 [Neurospora tetrasperma FGSC 2508]EGZ73536.1 hypothetical protein NEUTE2DRAFT_144201 [Neurospora tetrasperma FGSC 2509]